MKTLVLAAILSLAAAVRRGASECVRKGIPLPPARPLLNVSRLSAEGQKRRFRCGLKKARDRRERSKSRPLTYVRFLEPRRALGTAGMGAKQRGGGKWPKAERQLLGERDDKRTLACLIST